jgi:hypothetical protein
MELILIKKDSHEWNYMWEYISEHPYTKLLTEAEALRWQYTGSLRQDGKVLHQFKHGRKELVIASSDHLSEADFFKVIAVK